MLPPGYVRDGTGKVVKDPDERVREGIALVFKKFREIRSIRQTCLWFHRQPAPQSLLCRRVRVGPAAGGDEAGGGTGGEEPGAIPQGRGVQGLHSGPP